jgi:hypothetical protein
VLARVVTVIIVVLVSMVVARIAAVGFDVHVAATRFMEA